MRRDAPQGIAAEWLRVRPALRDLLRRACSQSAYPIYLFGDAGRGKTSAMACVYRSWRSDGVRWMRAIEFVELIQRCRRDGHVMLPGSNREVGEDHIWRVRVHQPSLLCVDDVGLRAPTESQYEILYTLIDRRGVAPTIYTGNLNPSQLHQTYDSRIASRLLRGQPIEVTGEDRRLTNVVIERV